MNGTFDSLDSQFDIDEPSSTITPIVRLRTAWINERCAPELLPFEEIAMESLLASIQKQVDLIESERNTDADTNFEMTLVMTEIERAKFIIRSYLRTRLHKLEKYAAFIVRNQEQMDKLSDDETRFVIGYVFISVVDPAYSRFQTLVEKHYMDSSLHSLPATMQKFDEEKGRATMCRFVSATPDCLTSSTWSGSRLCRRLQGKARYRRR